MKNLFIKKQTILALICFLILSPVITTYAVPHDGNGDPVYDTYDTVSDNSFTNYDPFADQGDVDPFGPVPSTGDPFEDYEFEPGVLIGEAAPALPPPEDASLFPPVDLGSDGLPALPTGTAGELPSPSANEVRSALAAARRNASVSGQGTAYAGGPAGTATGSSTSNSQGGATLSAASCIGSQLLGNILASTISSAIGSIINQVTDTLLGVAGAVISVPTNELGSVKYDTKRAKEQIQLSNSAQVGTSVGFGGLNALIGVSWDSVAYCIVNSMIDYIARSTIAWAQSGFKGNPSFIQNPGQFFKQLADVEASTFLQSLAYGTIGQNICQPFRAQIVLNIARNYTGGIGQSQVIGGGPTNGYTTGGFNGGSLPTGTVGTPQNPGALGTTRPTTIGGNTLASKSANMSYGGCSLDQINSNLRGFLKGNFSQGGWNSWLQLTQVQSNNPYSTYITLSGQLQGTIQKKKDLASLELNWGRGFLSFRKCEEKTPVKDQSKCPITTPGNLIQGQLEKTLGIPKDRLVLAQKFDQVIAVIVDQLITTALNKVLD